MILTDISLKRPVFATVTILALVVLGLFSYVSLNVDEYPNVEIPVVAVTVNYPGASPEQVESKVTQKVEETVSVVPGIDHITSTVKEGVSTTVIQFTIETSAATAAQDVRDKVGRMQGVLPDEAEAPIVTRFDPSDTAIASIAVTGSNLSPRELTIAANDIIVKRLEAINGVAAVNVTGGVDREIKINMDSNKIAAYNLTVSEVMNSIRSENMDTPGGKVTDGKRETSLRSVGSLSAPNQLLNLPIAQRNGVQLFVKNIATVEDSTKDIATVTKLNDTPSIGLDIMKQSGSNTVQVVENAKKELENIKKDLPAGVELVLVRDNSKNINDSIHDVLFNLILGGVLAVAIVFLFLGNWRSTMIAAIAIPTSIITSFLAMKILNFTLNTMSLLALSLAVGLLIDDAIVVIENIVRHLEMGKDKFKAAAEGTAEIGLAVTATTLTLVAVFLPVGMMTGIIGQFFKQFGITVAVSVLVSLFVAFTLTPMLSAKYLSGGHKESSSKIGKLWRKWNEKFDYWTGRYGEFLKYSLGHRKKIMMIAGALFVGSLMLLPFLGSTFVPDSDAGEITVSATVDPGKSPQVVGEIADNMSQIIRTVPEVTLTYSSADINNINIFTKLTEKSERKISDNQIVTDLRKKLSGIPGVQVSVSKKSGMSGGKPISLVIQGTSLDTLAEIAEQVEQIVASTPGAIDVTSSYEAGKPDAQIVIDRDKAADLGVSTSNVANTLQTMFNGTVVTQYRDEDDSYDVRLILAPDDRTSLADVNNLFVASANHDKNGQTIMVPLSQVTKMVYATSPTQIKRYDREDQITISANLSGVSLGDFNTALNKKLAEVKLPEGYKFVTTGQSQQMADAFKGIVMALAAAVLFIFFVLAAQFESYIEPFAIMLALPLAIIGAILGLLIAHSMLSMMSLIGIIMLMGLVTKNAILLIDFAKQRIAEGVERNQALVEAAVVRMRPILMTTTAMIFGMVPLALGIGPGAESRAPMAHAIIGGLITSTILTLIVVPIVYTLLDDFMKRRIKVDVEIPTLDTVAEQKLDMKN
jgi:hydrophobe/amphiphile efflux-1 (HAE1) family protein